VKVADGVGGEVFRAFFCADFEAWGAWALDDADSVAAIECEGARAWLQTQEAKESSQPQGCAGGLGQAPRSPTGVAWGKRAPPEGNKGLPQLEECEVQVGPEHFQQGEEDSEEPYGYAPDSFE